MRFFALLAAASAITIQADETDKAKFPWGLAKKAAMIGGKMALKALAVQESSQDMYKDDDLVEVTLENGEKATFPWGALKTAAKIGGKMALKALAVQESA